MRIKAPDSIICEKCIRIVGTVDEVEEPDRPGFFRNVPNPNPMPTRCQGCKGALTRIMGSVVYN